MNRLHPQDLLAIVASNLAVPLHEKVQSARWLLAEMAITEPKAEPGIKFTSGVMGMPSNAVAFTRDGGETWEAIPGQDALGVAIARAENAEAKVVELADRLEDAQAQIAIWENKDFCLQATLEENQALKERLLRYYHADGTFNLCQTPEEAVERRISAAVRIEEMEDRLSAIEIAEVGDPPCPEFDPNRNYTEADLKAYTNDLLAWSGDRAEAAAALRVDLAQARAGERERLCRKFTTTPYILKIHVPGSIEVVSLTFETALRHAAQEPRKEADDACPF